MAERKRDELQNEGSIPELEELAGSQPAAAEAPAAETAQTTEVPPMPTYDDAARQRQSALYEQIANRGPFQYDMDNDPLYRMARDRYVQNGRMSMKDTMGQAAALTGGYGSSYGQAVGQQAYDRQLQGLADMIPELYQTAYARYRDEGDRLKDLYSMAGAAADKDYDRYRDALGDWQYERAWAQQQDETAYGRQSEAYSRLYALIGATGYMPSAEELAAAGMTQEAADAIRNEYLRQTGQLPVAGGSGGGYYGGSGSGSGNKKTGGTGTRFINPATGSFDANMLAYEIGASHADDAAAVLREFASSPAYAMATPEDLARIEDAYNHATHQGKYGPKLRSESKKPRR